MHTLHPATLRSQAGSFSLMAAMVDTRGRALSFEVNGRVMHLDHLTPEVLRQEAADFRAMADRIERLVPKIPPRGTR